MGVTARNSRFTARSGQAAGTVTSRRMPTQSREFVPYTLLALNRCHRNCPGMRPGWLGIEPITDLLQTCAGGYALSLASLSFASLASASFASRFSLSYASLASASLASLSSVFLTSLTVIEIASSTASAIESSRLG